MRFFRPLTRSDLTQGHFVGDSCAAVTKMLDPIYPYKKKKKKKKKKVLPGGRLPGPGGQHNTYPTRISSGPRKARRGRDPVGDNLDKGNNLKFFHL